MAHSRAETMRVEERRARVAALAIQGLRPSEIAARLGVGSAKGRVKVSQDLKAVRDAWKATPVRDCDEAGAARSPRSRWRSGRRGRPGGGASGATAGRAGATRATSPPYSTAWRGRRRCWA
jgi:hypothetical protein